MRLAAAARCLGDASTVAKTPSNQCLTGQFPTHPNSEFFAALQGIKSGDQGNFRPDQGKRPSARVFARNRALRTAALIAALGPYPSAPLAETPRPSRRR